MIVKIVSHGEINELFKIQKRIHVFLFLKNTLLKISHFRFFNSHEKEKTIQKNRIKEFVCRPYWNDSNEVTPSKK